MSKMLSEMQSDIVLLLKQFEVDAAMLKREVDNSLDDLRSGNG